MARDMTMTPEQCRAARGWLDWPQQELAKQSNVGLSTIRQFENGIRTPIPNNMLAMRRAFEEAGITLTDEPAGLIYAGTGAVSDKNGTGAAP